MDINMETNAALNESVIQERQATLHEYSDVIDAANRNIEGILKEIGWTIEDVQSKESLVQCPINPHHQVADSSLQRHIERCKWVRDGYTREEQEESESLEANDFFYENKKDVHTVELDADCQREIMSRFPGTSNKRFPRTMSRLDSEFTPEERLAMYEKVREKSQISAEQVDVDLGLDLDAEKQDEEDKEKVKSRAEMMAEMRDYRRRRQSYRAKNVHITKKSKTDVMREIIESHMKFLEDTHSPAKEEDYKAQDRTHSRSREGSATSSRGTNDHRRHRRSRSRDRSSRRGDRSRSRDRSSRKGDRSRSSSRTRERGSRKGDRSRSGSRSRDGGSRHHKHHRHHSKHKHKHRHKSPTSKEVCN